MTEVASLNFSLSSILTNQSKVLPCGAPGDGTAQPVRSKYPKQLRIQGIMDARYEREPLGAVAGVCDRHDQSRTPPQERVSGFRKSDFAGPPASSAAAIRSGKFHAR